MNNKKKKFSRKKRKNKLAIVFDENARREFLTGFHKRKVQRKNKARELLEEQLKAERKRIKEEAKAQYMKLLLCQKSQSEFSDLVSENIDMGTHSVSITELSTADLARKNNWIGENETKYQEPELDERLNGRKEKSKNEELEGMEVRNKLNDFHISGKSSKDIRKQIEKHAAISVKNSKLFKKKAAMQKIRDIKLKKREERKLKKNKQLDKRSKHKKMKGAKYNG